MEQKNLGYLLEVYRCLTREPANGLRFELHLYGDGAQREALTAACVKQSLPRVTFHGEIPREQVPAASDACDLFLNTSHTEGQCLAALEVLSRGRPLVATPVGALPEVISRPELGRLAPLDDVDAFAAKVIDLVHDIHAGRITPESVTAVFARRYDQRAVLQRYLDLIAGLIEPSRPRELFAA